MSSKTCNIRNAANPVSPETCIPMVSFPLHYTAHMIDVTDCPNLPFCSY